MTIFYFFISIFIALVVIITLYFLLKTNERVNRIEKKLMPFLKELDDKNYRLWKEKVKAEEKLKNIKTA